MALEITSPWLPIHFGYILSGLFMLLITVIGYIAHDEKPYAGFRMFGTEPGDLVNSRAKERFVKNGISIMKRGLQECKNNVFQVVASGGPMLILPPSFVDEIRNDNRLSFPGAIERDWFPTYPGLEAVQALRHNIFQDMVKKNLMTSVGTLVPALDDEMDKVTEEMFPASKEWNELRFSPLSLQVVARLTARVFLGEPLCRNKEWIDLSIRYTIDAYLAAKTLRSWPPYLRPFVYRFLPELRVVRDQFQKARQIIEPEIAARRYARHQALLEGKPRPKSNDALSWFDDCAGDRPYDVTQGQMLLTIVSIHTTSSTLLALMYDIVGHSEYIDMLREEITQVLKEEKGLTKTSLHRMKLLDSCMKESQRLHPTGSVLLSRRVEATMSLSDGTMLPKGAVLAVPTHYMRESQTWGPNADKFDGHRFLRMREQPGNENRWQFVTTTAEHIGFGHGKHACLGRFLASSEIKVAMVHLLLKYDWKFKGEQPQSQYDMDYAPDPAAGIWCRARTSEVNL